MKELNNMEKWQYKTVKLTDRSMFESDLNDFGANGWELVSHSIISSNSSYTTILHHYTFKRRIVNYQSMQDWGPR